MQKLSIQAFPYHSNSETLCHHLHDLPWFTWLDSGYPYAQQGRYDIISALPYDTLITERAAYQSTFSFEQLKKTIIENNQIENATLPFVGGALGYFSYDMGREIEKRPQTACDDVSIPDMALGLYDWAIIVDHLDQKSWLVEQHPRRLKEADCQLIKQRLCNIGKPLTKPNHFELLTPFIPNLDYSAYRDVFEKVKTHIYAGDCYELNLTRRWEAQIKGSPWHAYIALRRATPTPFAAFINHPQAAILSLSPERFLHVAEGLVETKPIKGTKPRATDPAKDKQNAIALKNSEKDRAENLMIVDLMRNDLSRSCEVGSVKVPKLFDIESFPNVHHLVSTVTGKLAQGKHCVDLLKDCFPGGSITGAPKVRVMEIIEALEPHRRNIYCGSIGYISQNQRMDTQIAIRTLTWYKNSIYAAAGGAIVADSNVDDEFQETIDKIQRLLNVFNNEHAQTL